MSKSSAEHRESHAAPQLLLVDAGNTRVKFGLFRYPVDLTGRLPQCDACLARPCGDPQVWASVTGTFGAGVRPQQALVTGSNPQEVARLVSSWPANWPEPRLLIDRKLLPIDVDVDEPERVGVDRLLDAIAANALRAAGTPAIVIDVGTATTVNAVAKSGAFVGGAILPGPELCARALHEYTAVLPEVGLDDLGEPDVIGRNTEAAIASGLYWGHWQAVLGYCESMRTPLECPPDPLVLLTGGAAHHYADRIPSGARYEPLLTLQGLAIAAAHLFAREDES